MKYAENTVNILCFFYIIRWFVATVCSFLAHWYRVDLQKYTFLKSVGCQLVRLPILKRFLQCCVHILLVPSGDANAHVWLCRMCES